MRVGDVRIATSAQIRLTGKGRKMQIVPLMSETVMLLDDYLREHRLQENARLDKPLFFNRYGHRLTRSGVRYLLAKYAEQARQ